jgi:inorganic pyrophosphatase
MAEKLSTPVARLGPKDGSSGTIQAVIETPRGSRNKYKFDERSGLFKLSHVLPAGASFPYSFGFIPGTLAEDGDPLDVLVLEDEPVPVGCLVLVRLIGVLEAEQEEEGEAEKNHRLIAVAEKSLDHADLRSFKKISPHLAKEIEHFFRSYNEIRGRDFRILGRGGPKRAAARLQEAVLRAKQERREKPNGRG